ncbi:MAG: penicillin-binding protein [Euzebyales bacterium]|nr:penicillin-binding protein [Euzebyales bacterium]
MRKLLAVVLLATVLAVAGVAGYRTWDQRQDRQQRQLDAAQATAAVEDFLGAWRRGRYTALDELTADPRAPVGRTHRQLLRATGAEGVELDAGEVRLQADQATVGVTVSLPVPGLGDWTYDTRVTAAPAEDGWSVAWAPQIVHPDLGTGQRFQLVRRWPQRGAILASGGRTLASGNDLVKIGLRGERVGRRRAVITALTRHTDAEPPAVRAGLDRAADRPGTFVAVTTLSRADFDEVVDELTPVGGVFFESRERLRALGRQLPANVIGRVGRLSDERVAELGEPYVDGDVGGISGLEHAYERRLAGRPSGAVRIVGRGGRTVTTVRRWPARQARSVRATLDPALQRRAQAALSGVSEPAALVVLEAGSAAVRAVANAPVAGFDRALFGRYPPGSTFKVVTTTGLLAEDVVTPSSTVTCPVSATVGGRSFGNAEGEVLGSIPFRTAFFRSCNTAFVQLADRLRPAQLLAAAERMGFNLDDEPVESQFLPGVVGGSFPRPQDAAEQAEAAIGQGRVTASPLHMASVAAAVAGGGWRPPRFATAGPAAQPLPLPARDARVLRRLMHLVVRQGTGTNAAVPGRSIAGKTGTAEYGSGDPLPTHAWFIGFSGDLAVAVVVEGGGFGGAVAAPLAAEFFSALQ